MYKVVFLLSLMSLGFLHPVVSDETIDYTDYHKRVVMIETHIAAEDYSMALKEYETLFEAYDFIFLRDCQIATQLALFLKEEDKAKAYLLKGMAQGWDWKSIKKNEFLDPLLQGEMGDSIKKSYPGLNEKYESGLEQDIKERVRKMFSKDQWKALGALFTLSSEKQDQYAEKKFAPQSEEQVKEFLSIYDAYGYPGEQLIGNDYWMSIILSHHNSISEAYNRKDTLYQSLRPKLEIALKKGQLSAFEFVLIDEWYRSTINDSNLPVYAILDGPLQQDLELTNALRAKMFLRSVEVHNKLIDIEEATGMNFYLEGHPWESGRIEVRE